MPAVDGNVLRVISRVIESDEPISREETRRRMAAALSALLPKERPGDFNQALMELGAMVCLPNGAPRCERCPLNGFCLAHLHGSVDRFPARRRRRSAGGNSGRSLCCCRTAGVGIRRRPARGLLRGLWELPGEEGFLDEAQAQDWLAAQGFSPAGPLRPLGPAKHIFTHLEWQMQGWVVPITGAGALCFVTPEQLAEEYCLPSAFRAYADRIPNLIRGVFDV